MTPNKNSDEICIDKEYSRTDNENFHRPVLSVGQDSIYQFRGKETHLKPRWTINAFIAFDSFKDPGQTLF